MLRRLTTSRLAAVGVIFGLGLLPGLNLLGGALAGLWVLMKGWRPALIVTGSAAAVTVLFSLATPQGPMAVLIAPFGGPLLGTWVPALVLAGILRHGRSLALTLAFAALVGCLIVLGQLLFLPDPVVWWHHVLQASLAPLKNLHPELSQKDWHTLVARMAKQMPGMAAGGWLLGSMIMMILARWGQSRLLKPGAFREEFHALKLGKWITLAASAILVAKLLHSGLFLDNVAIVVLVMFLFQGLAVFHALAENRRGGVWALGAMYVLIVLLPLWLLGLISGAGLVDNWFDFRHWFRRT